jgi:hypothetical protein
MIGSQMKNEITITLIFSQKISCDVPNNAAIELSGTITLNPCCGYNVTASDFVGPSHRGEGKS